MRCEPQPWEIFRYEWLHIPTGQHAECTTAESGQGPLTRFAFLTLLNQWNQQQPGVWQYQERD